MARRKQIEFDGETFLALSELASDRMASFQELADEAFADLLKKYGRPVGLKAALRQSASEARGSDGKENVIPLHSGQRGAKRVTARRTNKRAR
jgi:hypothetical protein